MRNHHFVFRQRLLACRILGLASRWVPSQPMARQRRVYSPLALIYRRARHAESVSNSIPRFISRDGVSIVIAPRLLFRIHLNAVLGMAQGGREATGRQTAYPTRPTIFGRTFPSRQQVIERPYPAHFYSGMTHRLSEGILAKLVQQRPLILNRVQTSAEKQVDASGNRPLKWLEQPLDRGVQEIPEKQVEANESRLLKGPEQIYRQPLLTRIMDFLTTAERRQSVLPGQNPSRTSASPLSRIKTQDNGREPALPAWVMRRGNEQNPGKLFDKYTLGNYRAGLHTPYSIKTLKTRFLQHRWGPTILTNGLSFLPKSHETAGAISWPFGQVGFSSRQPTLKEHKAFDPRNTPSGSSIGRGCFLFRIQSHLLFLERKKVVDPSRHGVNTERLYARQVEPPTTQQFERSVMPIEVVYRPAQPIASPNEPARAASTPVAPIMPKIDVEQVSRDVLRQLEKRLRVERQSRGLL